MSWRIPAALATEFDTRESSLRETNGAELVALRGAEGAVPPTLFEFESGTDATVLTWRLDADGSPAQSVEFLAWTPWFHHGHRVTLTGCADANDRLGIASEHAPEIMAL